MPKIPVDKNLQGSGLNKAFTPVTSDPKKNEMSIPLPYLDETIYPRDGISSLTFMRTIDPCIASVSLK